MAYIKVGFIFLFLAFAAYGQQQERVAIINTVDDGDSIKPSDLAYLTDRLRETASNVLPKQRYGVMTTESIVAFLGSQERAQKECREASCLAELGRKVSADYVAQARIGRFSGNLTIKTELYSSKSGVMVGSFTGSSKDMFGLLAYIDEKASDLFKKLPGASGEASNLEKVITHYELEDEKPVVDEKPYVPTPAVEKPIKTSFWVALGLDVLGAAIIYLGYEQDKDMMKFYDRYSITGQTDYNQIWSEVDNSRSNRNTLYVIGGIILASGIGVHIWF